MQDDYHGFLEDVEVTLIDKTHQERILLDENEPEFRKDFEEFCRRMRYKWHFRNEVSETFSEIPAF